MRDFILGDRAPLLHLPLLLRRPRCGRDDGASVVVLVLFVFSVVFWSAFEQQPTSLNLFARDFTDRTWADGRFRRRGSSRPSRSCVILFAPVLAAIWLALGRRGRDLSSPTKFAIALSLAGVGFLLMVAASNRVIAGGGGTRVSMCGSSRATSCRDSASCR